MLHRIPSSPKPRCRDREMRSGSETHRRSVIHVDLDAFFASVEELLDPSIAGLPIIVGGDPAKRGVVASASYAARAYGVRSAMPMAQALRLCPQAIVRHGHREAYASYSRRVMAILAEYTPLLEQVSIDEAFLDVTGCEQLFGPPEEIARCIQQRIRSELGLPASLGVASNKLVAKVASTLAKPRGLLVVPPGEEAAFLAPLAIEYLWGVGKVTAERLHSLGVQTIGQLAALPDQQMKAVFGSAAAEMHRRALGIDDSPVGIETRRKSVSQEHTFPRDVADVRTLQRYLLEMSEGLAAQLRKEGECARTVVLKIRYPDFRTVTRRVTLEQPTDLTEAIYAQATALLEREWKPGERVRLIGLAVTGLVQARQLSLFGASTQRLAQLSRAVDEIRSKYGEQAIRRASLLNHDHEDK
ncbi:MAG: DNA polymerase IV [Anaerolineae bacterium]